MSATKADSETRMCQYGDGPFRCHEMRGHCMKKGTPPARSRPSESKQTTFPNENPSVALPPFLNVLKVPSQQDRTATEGPFWSAAAVGIIYFLSIHNTHFGPFL